MNNKKKLLKKLKKEVITLEKHVKNIKLYNIKNTIIKTMIDGGMIIERACPYILSSFILFQLNLYGDNDPFTRDLIYDIKRTETIKTSTGVIFEKRLNELDVTLKEGILEFSTPWVINEYGFYERKVTRYQVGEVDLNDEKILLMDKKELDNNYQIIDIQDISKDKLDGMDEIYNQEMIITRTFKDKIDYESERYETIFEMASFLILHSILIYVGAFPIKLVRRKFIKKDNYDELKLLKEKYIILKEEDIPNIKEVIEIKKNNLLLFDEEIVDNRQLIKKKVNYDIR